MKPGSCGPAALGIQLVIYDENGEEIPRGSGKAGYICVRNPWPGRMLTVWGQDQRFIDTYYAKFNKDKDSKDWRDWPFMCGDGAVEAPDGYFRILGRIDDVINVAGHRLGTKELESAAITVDEVAEAAAVPVVDEIRGQDRRDVRLGQAGGRPGRSRPQGVRRDRQGDRGDRPPKNVWIVKDMPKTRSGKIMRRVIAAVSNFTDTGDVSTLANPEIVDEIRHHVQSEKAAKGEVPRELSERREAGDRRVRTRGVGVRT